MREVDDSVQEGSHAPEDKEHAGRGGHDMSAMVAGNERALKISSWLTGIYFVIELVLGIYSGSVAVISDAFHTLSAVGGVLLALAAGRIAAKPADRYRTYGSIRAEIVGALLNGLFLFLMAALVVYMGIKRLLDPVEVEFGLMIAAAGGGLITELISLKVLFSGQKGSLNMKGVFWHVMQTFVGSLIIILAAVIIYTTGFLAIDPILGIAFGLVLFWASWGITRDSLRILMETVPSEINVREVRDALTAVDGIEGIHHLHAWALTSGKNLFSAHLLIEDRTDHDRILTEARGVLRTRFGFYFSTLQLEKSCIDAGEASEIDFADG